ASAVRTLVKLSTSRWSDGSPSFFISVSMFIVERRAKRPSEENGPANAMRDRPFW
ncbi:MAG: hypothetical protein JWQ16_713, partial [Novosphingobium sp.]|nr:hypothetical protein [Novosphingobium sp.]